VEHRWGQRLSVRARVGLRARGNSRGIGYIQDISISGALVVSGMRPTPMSFVRVFLPERSRKAMCIEGQVIRCTNDGFAVEWCELALDVVRSLAQPDVATDARVADDVPSIVNNVAPVRQPRVAGRA
jgi:hypothetical protein